MIILDPVQSKNRHKERLVSFPNSQVIYEPLRVMGS